jgi:hypothetical protein
MSFDKIKSTDLVEANFVENIINELNKLKPELQALATSLKETLAASSSPQTAAEVKKLKQQIDDLNAATETYKNVTKEVSQAEKDQIAEKVRNQMESQKLRKEARLNIQASQDNKSAYEQLNATYEINSKKVKDLLASNKELTDADKALIRETQDLDKKLKEIGKTVGQNQRNVGNYQEAIETASMSIGEMRKELRALQDKGFGSMTDDQINSTKLRMADLTDAMGKAKNEINAMSNDSLPALNQSVQMISQSANSYVQTMLMFGDVSEEDRKSLQNLLKATTVLQTAVGTLTTLQQAYVSGSIKANVQKTISTVKTAALTAANWLAAASQTAWTAAVKLFSTSIYGIPVFGWLLAIISAIIGVVVLLYKNWEKITNLFKSSEEILEDNAVALERYNKALESMNKLHRDSENALEYRIKLLKAQGAEAEEVRRLEMNLMNERIKNAKQKLILDLNELLRLGKSGKITKKEFEERKKEIDDEIFSYKKLIQERKILDAQQTSDRKKEEEKRLKDELDAKNKLKEQRLKNNDEIEKERLRQKQLEEEIAKLTRDAAVRNMTDRYAAEKQIIENAYNDNIQALKKQGKLSEELAIQLKIEQDRKLKELEEKRTKEIEDEIIKRVSLTKKEISITDELYKKEQDNIKKQEEAIKKIVQTSQNAFNEVAKLFESQRKRDMEIMDERVNREQRLLESKKELAARGIDVDIAAQQEALAKLEAERERAEIKRRRRERQTAIMQTFLKLIETERPELALGKAIALVSGIQGFYDGTDELGKKDGAKIKNGGKDPLLIKAHPGEMILNPKESNFVRNTVGNRKDLINFIKQNHSNTSTTNQTITSIQEIKLKADVDSFGSVIISLSDKSSGTHTHTRFPKNTRI